MQSYEDFRLNTTFFLYCSPSYYDKCRKCTPFCLTPVKNVVSSAKRKASLTAHPDVVFLSLLMLGRVQTTFLETFEILG